MALRLNTDLLNDSLHFRQLVTDFWTPTGFANFLLKFFQLYRLPSINKQMASFEAMLRSQVMASLPGPDFLYVFVNIQMTCLESVC